MADNKSRETIAELNVKVNVDVSEALSGLKALQREAKEAAKALRELEKAQETTALIEIDGRFLTKTTISGIAEELAHRSRRKGLF